MRNRPDKLATDIRKVVRGQVWPDIIHRASFSTDASIYQIVPACVVAPCDANDIAAVVKYAANHSISVVARGAGSGVAGESLCSGIVFDMTSHMNRILSIEDNGARVVCEPGVVLDDLNRILSGYERKIGPDPSTSNRATIGGCVANNSTGAHSLEYGYIGDHVERIEAVLADGEIADFTNDFDPRTAEGNSASAIAEKCLSLLADKQDIIRNALPGTKRNRSGYTIADICHDGRIDLARLLAGSEGTLATFTKIELRTVPLPAVKGLIQFEFDRLEATTKVVPTVVETGASACELMDGSLIAMARKALPKYRDILPQNAQAVLLVEHTGQTPEEVEGKIAKTDKAVGDSACGRRVILDPAEQSRLWKARKDAVPLLDRERGRKHPVPFIEDVSVDNRRLGEYINGLQEIGERYDIPMSYYGHAGDGELHVRPYLDLSDPAEIEKMRSIANDVFSLAWSLGGSISGEHADGLVRAAFIRRQYGDDFYKLLQQIKRIFDPNNLLNPGKIITDDPEVMTRSLRAVHRILPERLKTDLHFDDDELLFELQQCSGCGVCLSRESGFRMCPVFRALGDELASSRAKANLLRFWAAGQLSDEDFQSPEFRKFLDLCVNCKACLLECPSGVDVSKLIAAARARYVKNKKLRRPEFVLSHNRHLSRIGSTLGPVSNYVMRLPITKWLLEKTAGLDQRRDMPEFAWGSFLPAGQKYLKACEPVAEPVDRVAYFVDTYANFNDHELGFAVIDVLRNNSIEVILPRQRPTPLPAICYGDVKTARRDLRYIVRHLAKAIRDGYKIICSEPSAALCLQQELRHFVRGADAELVSKNTFELMGYLLELYKQGKLNKPEFIVRGSLFRVHRCEIENRKSKIENPYVYHTPCHLSAIGGSGATIELLKELCGIEVVDLQGGCCGLAGTFGMQKKNYELSGQIAEDLKQKLLGAKLDASTVKNVLTECSACKMQIEHLANVTATHPIKVLAACYTEQRNGPPH